jgi:hypothetical protein
VNFSVTVLTALLVFDPTIGGHERHHCRIVGSCENVLA